LKITIFDLSGGLREQKEIRLLTCACLGAAEKNKSLKVAETLELTGGREKKGAKSEEVKHVHTKSPHLLKMRVIWLFSTMWRERTTSVRRNDDGKESIARIDGP
jgi:hypothetical protein